MNIKEEYKKCKEDPYYFFKNYCVVKDKETGKTVNINFSRIYYDYLKNYCIIKDTVRKPAYIKIVRDYYDYYINLRKWKIKEKKQDKND